MVNQEAVHLVSPKIEADIEVVRALVAGQFDEGLLVFERHGHGEVVDLRGKFWPSIEYLKSERPLNKGFKTTHKFLRCCIKHYFSNVKSLKVK